MDIHVIKTGSTLVSSAVPDRSSHRWGLAYTDLFQRRSRRICVPVKAFLVECSGHRVLVDASWSAACIGHPIRHLGFGLWFASEPVLAEGEDALSQLKGLGLAPEDLDAIILTHLDCDHASGLVPLKGAKRIFCSAEELTHAQTRDVRYRPKFWEGVAIEPVAMAEDLDAPFGKSADIFGDGSVKAYLTPGHSAGSVAVLAQGGHGFAAFVGDDSYNRHSWEEQKLPGPLSDADEMRKTLAWVRSLAQDPDCIGIYAAHDPEGPAGGCGL